MNNVKLITIGLTIPVPSFAATVKSLPNLSERMLRATSNSGTSPHHLAANMIPAVASLMSSLHSLHTKHSGHATEKHARAEAIILKIGDFLCKLKIRDQIGCFKIRFYSTYCGLSNWAACSIRHLQYNSIMSKA